jgi:hypothetical protein
MQPEPAEPVAQLPVVRPGALCRVPGNYGCSKGGTVLVCALSGTSRPRWRRAAGRVAA